jgi:hypothetical protein
MSNSSKLYVTSDEILRFLPKTLRLWETHNEILCRKIIDQVSQDRKLFVAPEEIQTNINQMFIETGLEQASDSLLWKNK